jgi:uncharacterized membrane protein YjjP (DUF1212 family)
VSYGCPSYRLEEVIRVVADIEGYRAQAFALPTGLFVSLDVPGAGGPVLRMIRVRFWATNLERLVEVDAILNDVAERRSSIRDARRRLGELDLRPPPYPPALKWVATAVVSAAAAVFFRGGPMEIGVAGITGGSGRTGFWSTSWGASSPRSSPGGSAACSRISRARSSSSAASSPSSRA